MQYNRPFVGNGGTARSHFFASSESNIEIPGHHLVSAADKFVNSNGQTVVLFRTSRAVAWTDAMALFPRGVIVTICKGPNASLDEAMFNLMLKALIASPKWTHSNQPINRTVFETNALGITTVASPSPVPVAPVVINHDVMVTKHTKREREDEEPL